MLNTTRLPFKILALPYLSLMCAGLPQEATCASWNQASSSTFDSGYRLANAFSGLLDITRIYLHGCCSDASRLFPIWEKRVQRKIGLNSARTRLRHLHGFIENEETIYQ